jgi:hypothetical protein
VSKQTNKQIIKIFLLEGFLHLPLVSLTPVANLEQRISQRIFEKIQNGPNGIIRGLGETGSEKTRSKKSRDTVPFKQALISPPPLRRSACRFFQFSLSLSDFRPRSPPIYQFSDRILTLSLLQVVLFTIYTHTSI